VKIVGGKTASSPTGDVDGLQTETVVEEENKISRVGATATPAEKVSGNL
jgi:hypothetical protein